MLQRLHRIIMFIHLKNAFIKRLHVLVRMLNIIEYYNEDNVHGISTNFIRKLIDLLFTIIGENNIQMFH